MNSVKLKTKDNTMYNGRTYHTSLPSNVKKDKFKNFLNMKLPGELVYDIKHLVVVFGRGQPRLRQVKDRIPSQVQRKLWGVPVEKTMPTDRRNYNFK